VEIAKRNGIIIFHAILYEWKLAITTRMASVKSTAITRKKGTLRRRCSFTSFLLILLPP
jgi:hypothetical protein